MDPEWEFLDHIINKSNGILLTVTWEDFHCPNTGGIIISRILKASDSVALKVPQREEFNINLNGMTGNLFGITSCE